MKGRNPGISGSGWGILMEWRKKEWRLDGKSDFIVR